MTKFYKQSEDYWSTCVQSRMDGDRKAGLSMGLTGQQKDLCGYRNLYILTVMVGTWIHVSAAAEGGAPGHFKCHPWIRLAAYAQPGAEYRQRSVVHESSGSGSAWNPREWQGAEHRSLVTCRARGLSQTLGKPDRTTGTAGVQLGDTVTHSEHKDLNHTCVVMAGDWGKLTRDRESDTGTGPGHHSWEISRLRGNREGRCSWDSAVLGTVQAAWFTGRDLDMSGGTQIYLQWSLNYSSHRNE